jgi:hypothetical protein
MAKRRMFSLDVIDTDMFLDMSVGSQNLYFHLAMRADDDGFVSSPKKIIKITNATQNDYDILIAKQFIIPFETGVCVIKHWKLHNIIKNDRYKKTIYHQEMASISQDENNVYNLEPNWNQTGTKLEPQVRLGKDRLGKDRLGNTQQMFNDGLTDVKQKNYNLDYARKLVEGKDTQEFEDKYSISQDIVIDIAEELVNYVASTGKRYKDYKATMHNWIKRKLGNRKTNARQSPELLVLSGKVIN